MNWSYIAGFFDGEGSIVPISSNGKSYRVSIAQSNKEVLELMAEFLDQYGIHTWITYKQPTSLTRLPGYHLSFSKSTSVRFFLEIIEGEIIVKRKLVLGVLNNLTDVVVTPISETELVDMIAMHNDGLPQREIANLLGRSQYAVSSNLRRRCCR